MFQCIAIVHLSHLACFLLYSGDDLRALEFDTLKHKLLNSELKYLYTALTRARCNLWIYDEDKDKRAPMFSYFKARKLVRVSGKSSDTLGQYLCICVEYKIACSVVMIHTEVIWYMLNVFCNIITWSNATRCFVSQSAADYSSMNLSHLI